MPFRSTNRDVLRSAVPHRKGINGEPPLHKLHRVITPPPPGPPPESYSPAELARRLGVSAPTIQRWVDQGHLRAWKTVGGHRRIDAASAEAFIASQQAASGGESAAPAPVSVLIVDDNESDRDVLAALVEEALPQAAIRLMDNGFQALTSIGQVMPQVLVTDIVMPHMNGIEMLRHVCQAGQRPQLVVAVSSYTAEQVEDLGGLPEGVVRMAKPVAPAPFIELLRQVTAGVHAPPPVAGPPEAS